MHSEQEDRETRDSLKEDAGHFFRYMAEFVKFSEEDAGAIRESALIIEKHLPAIISEFYINLLSHPETRKFFQKKDGSIDAGYLQLRMYHQANFWRRAAGAEFNDEFAGFVHYVGQAHTSRGADPHIYIHEQYVIGMVGFVQNAIIEALIKELDEYNKDLEFRAILAWNKLCIILLEILSRAYREIPGPERLQEMQQIDQQDIRDMSIDSYEKSVGIHREYEYQDIFVGLQSEIPEGERRLIDAFDVSIGVFHHNGNWFAIRNSCLHRGGPVATGKLKGDHLVCPWHGYTYDLTTGRLLIDPSAKLEMYKVILEDGKVFVRVPILEQLSEYLPEEFNAEKRIDLPEEVKAQLQENEFYLQDIPPGRIRVVRLNQQRIAVYNVDGDYYATSEECTHAGGPLSEGTLDGLEVTCPWHDSCFDVTTGAVTCPPADEPVKTYRVILDGIIGKVTEPVN